MVTRVERRTIAVDGEGMAGAMLSPRARIPGVLFVHGWGGSQRRDLGRARGIAGLGCICLTFDLRGHGDAAAQQATVTRGDNLEDVLAAYDCLLANPEVDPQAVGVVGTSYGGYLGALLSSLRPVHWLALRVPALYRDSHWQTPKGQLDRADLAHYRSRLVPAQENRALRACLAFTGDVLLVESEHDRHVPHATIMSYRAAFRHAHSMTHRIIDGADHALRDEDAQRAYSSILLSWITEMVVGKRLSITDAL